MPEFSYIARDTSGEKQSGTIEAASHGEAVAQLGTRSLFPVEVAEVKAPTKRVFRRRVGGQLVATTYGQLAALLRSGVPLLRSVAILRDQTSHPVLQEVLSEVHARVEDGDTLAEAMSRHPRAFQETAISMVRAGGEGGFLEEALDRIAGFTEEQEDLKARTLGALAYPIFLSFVGIAVVTGLLIFFVPNFEQIFARLRERNELPWATEALLAISGTLRSYGPLIALALVIGFFLLRVRLKTDAGRLWRDRWLIKLPIVGGVFLSLAVARFCRVLGTLLRNGVPILKALQISRDSTGNRVLSTAIGEASENISSGESLAAPLAASGHFPRDVVEMVAVAEESNTLDRVLIDIADGLERRTARRLDLAVRLLEPIMLMILAGIVMIVVIALLLPVLKMSSTL